MSTLQITQTKIKSGVWHGIVKGSQDSQPNLEVTHEGHVLRELTWAYDRAANQWSLDIQIPADVIADGVQTVIIRDVDTEATVASFGILAGDVLAQDMRAELDLLRAELDLLKRAFRHHCAETEQT